MWRRRVTPVKRLEPPPWPRADHLDIAMIERKYWAKVVLKPCFLSPAPSGSQTLNPGIFRGLSSSLTVLKELGCITAVSACASGTLLVAGTEFGAMLVWDMREENTGPSWFQVCVNVNVNIAVHCACCDDVYMIYMIISQPEVQFLQ